MKPIFYYAMLAVVVSVVLVLGIVQLTEPAYAVGYCWQICPSQCSSINCSCQDPPQTGPCSVCYCGSSCIDNCGNTIRCKSWCCSGPCDDPG
jgi:hypothetical protein